MGPRPADFDEALVRQSPTFVKWMGMEPGQKLRYACREFIRGQGDDEERLMRRIMIARRNNLKDHKILKRARQSYQGNQSSDASKKTKRDDMDSSSSPSKFASVEETLQHLNAGPNEATTRRRRPPAVFSDAYVMKEMDVPAVVATRSYRAWLKLQDGQEFVYNQKYIKGKETHDWLLRKNIWRRMRYRRENKKMVEELRQSTDTGSVPSTAGVVGATGVSSQIVDGTLLANTSTAMSAETNETDAGKKEDGDFEVAAAVEAAVAVAESYVKSPYNVVHNPLEAAANTAALDAAARLAAAAASSGGVDDNDAAVVAAAEAATAASKQGTQEIETIMI